MICMQAEALKIDFDGTGHGILLDSDFGGVDRWSELSGGVGTRPQLSPIGSCRKRKKRRRKKEAGFFGT